MKVKGKARAHANIALIKYWGKRNDRLVLPMNGSLSLTLDCFYTETEVIFKEDIEKDYFYLNDNIQDEVATNKISNFLDLFRKAVKINMPAVVKSINYVPTAAGLASSASGFAALAAAANVASGLNLNNKELSIYARRGSGSATRSIYGGLVEWQKGICNEDSYAVPIDDAKWDIGMVVVIVNAKEKLISSREGMKRTVETSPFYEDWVEGAEEDLKQIKVAIKKRDFEQMGLIAERNGLKMHATMLGANPPLSYWEPESVTVMQIVRELRKEGIPCYFTMDAGPNVKILCKLSESQKIKERLTQFFDKEQIIITGPGPGVTIL
ncbi:diphosphomevalonate decarboxylase [Clostridium sp. Cult2]|uniref:diphosphomevalonate decarboxylase n=1 Tax=Clostridium sp. Cult2 TaxID=2079003 RepID=UPI001EFF691B|nr:diphosphomevalonate decarboxylase [Clostridium sp. Cult2]